MSAPLVSGSWYRVAPLKPSLVSGLKIVRQPVRDQLWHVLVEPGSGRQLRLNPAAYAFVGRCDGQATVENLWQQLLARGGDDAPTQDEVIQLLGQLHGADLLMTGAARRPPRTGNPMFAFLNNFNVGKRLAAGFRRRGPPGGAAMSRMSGR